jgi:hypothetical protein
MKIVLIWFVVLQSAGVISWKAKIHNRVIWDEKHAEEITVRGRDLWSITGIRESNLKGQ